MRAANNTVGLVALGVLTLVGPTDRAPKAEIPPRAESPIDSLFADLARDTARDIKGVLIARDDSTVAEAYFNGDDSSTLHDIRSATKSITSLLVGIALDRHLLDSDTQSVGGLLHISGLRSVALHDVLTMRSGLDDDDRDSSAAGNEVHLDQSHDWLAFASHVPLTSAPGTRYVYASLNAFLAGAVVERVSGMRLSQFADQMLFQPIGIRRFAWQRGPREEGSGQGNLSVTLRDLARIGRLMLNRGAANGHQIVSAAWVEQALAAVVPIASVDPYADWYGYMWYRRTYCVGGRSVVVHFASGNGGNKIYIIPAAHLVVAITSRAYNTSYGQRRSERALRRILDALIARSA